jgi:hypothetical protein
MLQIEGYDPQASQIVPFVAYRSHTYVSHAYRNYCACSMERISNQLAMHHGTRGMCSMSSSSYIYTMQGFIWDHELLLPKLIHCP